MAYFKSETQRVNFVKQEEEILAFWDREKTFERSVARRKGSKQFVFVEGPPTANGLPHPGHILTRVVKDLILRYKTMQGYYVKRKAGWDTHGLPVEIEVEKELGINTKGEIEVFGIEKFNRKCKDSVFRYEKEWVNATKRVGFWIDIDSPYITFDTNYIESVWWSLKEVWKKGLLYKGHKVVPFCPRCETTLSSHEVAQGYRDVEDPSVYVKFKLKQEDEQYLLAWTTTPWTLMGNIALAVHPTNTYVKVKHKEEQLILAEARLDVLEGEYEILERFEGKTLENMEYERLFEYAKVEGGEAHKVITAEFVTLEEGTGIVHIAPAFGEVDYEVCRDKKLGFSQPVNSAGHFTHEVPPLEGMFVKDADRHIIGMMKQRGVLYKESRYLHSYPFCWRCGSPLLYYARESWFIAMKSLRDNLLANNEEINWYPAHLKHGRFGNFLEGIEDWALSRERFWGTPLNIWICTGCGKDFCAGSIKELKDRAGNSIPSDLHRPYIDEVVLSCEDCGGEMIREKDVIDCWYDSGSAPFAQWHYPFETDMLFKQNFPADFITEAIDQTRGWFYSLLAVSTAIFAERPYLNVLSLGHILDENGVKMSKSKGNVVDITAIFNNEGADALRWYFVTAGPLYDDIRFSEQGIIEKEKKFLNTFWNSYFFFVTYAAIDRFNPKAKEIPVENRNAMDRWIISRWNTLATEVIEAIERFEIHVAARKIEDFVINDLSNWYIRRSRRRFWVPEENFDKECAYLTLYEVLVSLCKLLAPFVPFITEHVYQNLMRTIDEDALESVHLCDYPSSDESRIDAALEDSMALVSGLVEAGRRARSDAGIKIRQPLKDVVVVCSASKREKVASLSAILKDELNIRAVKLVDAESGLATAGEYKQVNVDEDTTLFLNTGLDTELIEEGIVRDVVRRIQGMRKDIDLEYTAKIRIMYSGDEAVEEAINRFAGYIREETLAVELKEGKSAATSERIYAKKWKIDNKAVHLAIEAA
ncbi:MAG: isoleucine--tRNA ligase [Halobacteriota archaeon]